MSERNPYAAPATRSVEPQLDIRVPDEIARPIRNGWIAAVISGVLTLAVTLYGMSKGTTVGLFSAWNLIDVVLIALLAYGIHRRSRVASTSMFVYFVISKLLTFRVGTGLFTAILFLVLYYRAMTATYRYHRFMARARRNPPPAPTRLSDDPFFSQLQRPTQTHPPARTPALAED